MEHEAFLIYTSLINTPGTRGFELWRVYCST